MAAKKNEKCKRNVAACLVCRSQMLFIFGWVGESARCGGNDTFFFFLGRQNKVARKTKIGARKKSFVRLSALQKFQTVSLP